MGKIFNPFYTMAMIFAHNLLINSAFGWVDIAYYRFEEGNAGTAATGIGTILDSSGNGLNGTAANNSYSANVAFNIIPQTGMQNNKSIFYNTTGSIDIADNVKFQLTKSLTLEALIYPTSLNTVSQQLIIIRGDTRNGLDPYFMTIVNNNLIFHVESLTNYTNISTTIPATNQWYHVAGTLDDNTGAMKLYLNGNLASSTITGIRPFALLDSNYNPSVSIGGPSQFGTFNGYIDEVRISDMALRPDQFLNSVPVPETSSIIYAGIASTILIIKLIRVRLCKIYGALNIV
jgi:hypothetical protein